MRLTFNPEIQSLLEVIRGELESGQELYLVGGAVRDAILGQEINDLDFALPEDPTTLVKKLAKRLKVGYFVLDDDRHTARLLYQDRHGDPLSIDFAQFTGSSLDADLRNRDFRVNAIVVSIHDPHTLIDPLNGKGDLQAGLLQPCSNHALLDDPLRVLRGIRLSWQLGLKYSFSLKEMMLAASDHLPRISFERQRDEMFKILDRPHPGSAVSDCFSFKVFNTLLPPLSEIEGIPASHPHVLSLFNHTLKAVEYCDCLIHALISGERPGMSDQWWVDEAVSGLGTFSEEIKTYFQEEITPGRSKQNLILLGALLQDIGKPSTLTKGEDGRSHYYGHEKVSAGMAWELGKRMMLSNAESEWLRKLVLYHMCPVPFMHSEKLPAKRAIHRFFKDTGSTGIAVVILSLADKLATYGETIEMSKWQHEVNISRVLMSSWWVDQNSVVSPPPLLNGNDIQALFGLAPGKRIGTLLTALTEAQACGEVRTKEEAKVFIQDSLNNTQRSNQN